MLQILTIIMLAGMQGQPQQCGQDWHWRACLWRKHSVLCVWACVAGWVIGLHQQQQSHWVGCTQGLAGSLGKVGLNNYWHCFVDTGSALFV